MASAGRPTYVTAAGRWLCFKEKYTEGAAGGGGGAPDEGGVRLAFAGLAAAELGLGDVAKANEYADRAIAILSKQVAETQDGKAVLNPDYADGLIVKGDILNAEKKYEDAIGEYKKAENIYSKLFDKNLNNDVISRLYFRFASSYFNGKNIPAYEEYRDAHEKIFGKDNDRTKELYLLNKKS